MPRRFGTTSLATSRTSSNPSSRKTSTDASAFAASVTLPCRPLVSSIAAALICTYALHPPTSANTSSVHRHSVATGAASLKEATRVATFQPVTQFDRLPLPPTVSERRKGQTTLNGQAKRLSPLSSSVGRGNQPRPGTGHDRLAVQMAPATCQVLRPMQQKPHARDLNPRVTTARAYARLSTCGTLPLSSLSNTSRPTRHRGTTPDSLRASRISCHLRSYGHVD